MKVETLYGVLGTLVVIAAIAPLPGIIAVWVIDAFRWLMGKDER